MISREFHDPVILCYEPLRQGSAQGKLDLEGESIRIKAKLEEYRNKLSVFLNEVDYRRLRAIS